MFRNSLNRGLAAFGGPPGRASLLIYWVHGLPGPPGQSDVPARFQTPPWQNQSPRAASNQLPLEKTIFDDLFSNTSEATIHKKPYY